MTVGTTVTWAWGDDVGRAQRRSRQRRDAGDERRRWPVRRIPTQYTFNTLGTFHYHCQAHGNVGGVGMSGTVTVVTVAP